jgi:hypothetical protein
MRSLLSFPAAVLVAVCSVSPLAAQGRQGPDSLVNTLVIPHNTPVPQVMATMRGFTGALGVRCEYCHVEREGGQPNFPLDDALGVLRLDAEFFPNSAGVGGQMGEAYLAKADTANAIAMYRQAIQRDPNDRLARQRLRALGVTN